MRIQLNGVGGCVVGWWFLDPDDLITAHQGLTTEMERGGERRFLWLKMDREARKRFGDNIVHLGDDEFARGEMQILRRRYAKPGTARFEEKK